jgi:beta-galactosidase/beta-glucuronidase
LLAVCCDFDYNDKEAVQKQQEEVLLLVKQFKNNPAVLFWAIGNELDFIHPIKYVILKFGMLLIVALQTLE